MGCWCGGVGGMWREELNDAFPSYVLYHYYLIWIPWIVLDLFLWQIGLKCKKKGKGGWGRGVGMEGNSKLRQDRVMVQRHTAPPLNVLHLCMHFKFPSALLELCQGQQNWISEIIQIVSKAEQRFLYTALSLNIVYHFMNFQQNPLNSFVVMLVAKSFFKGK